MTFPPSVIITIVVSAVGGGGSVIACVKSCIDSYDYYCDVKDYYVVIRTYGKKNRSCDMRFSGFLTISKLEIKLAGMCVAISLIFLLLIAVKIVKGVGNLIYVIPTLEGIAFVLIMIALITEIVRYLHNK